MDGRSTTLRLTRGEHKELMNQISFLRKNNSQKIRRPPPPSLFLFSDACATGGVLSTHEEVLHIEEGKWDEKKEHARDFFTNSCVSEPIGMIQVLEKTLPLVHQIFAARNGGDVDDTPHLRILCDHEPLVWACFHYNTAVDSIYCSEKRWGLHLSVQFIQGKVNPADFPSRGLPLPPAALELAFAQGESAPEPDQWPRFMT